MAYLVRRVAVSVAGAVGECGPRSLDEVVQRLQTQGDWLQAMELSWFAASLRPGQALIEPVLEALIQALHTPPWMAAIQGGAETLLHAAGDKVPPEAFVMIIERLGLTLPGIEAVIQEPFAKGMLSA